MHSNHMSNGRTLLLKLGNEKKELVVGDRCKEALYNINMSWHSFVKNYWPNCQKSTQRLSDEKEDHFDPSKERIMLDALPLNLGSVSIEEATRIIEELCKEAKANPQKFTIAVARHLSLHDSLMKTSSYLFFWWKDKLEQLIRGLCNPDQLKETLNKWKDLDSKYSIHSSSILLTALAPPDLHWDSADLPLPTLELKIEPQVGPNPKGWVYKGFCPKRAISRFRALLEFPIELYCQKIAEFEPLEATTLVATMDQRTYPDSLHCRCKTTSKDEDKYQRLFNSVEAFLELLGQLKPFLIQHEKYCVHLSEQLAAIASKGLKTDVI